MAIADGSQVRTAIIKEVTAGTTPATPAWKTVREDTSDLDISRPRAPSDSERRADRMLASTYRQVGRTSATIQTKLCEDDALDILIESLMCAAWSTDNIKNGVLKVPLSMEKTYEQGASDTYIRGTGLHVNSMSFSAEIDQEIRLGFELLGMTGSTDSAIVASATYAAASTKRCHTVIDAVVGGLYGLTTPKIQSMNFNITNGDRAQAAWSSADPVGIGLGKFRCEGSARIYFETKAQVDAFMTAAESSIDITFGETTLEKYQFIFNRVQVLNFKVEDAGNDSDVGITLMFQALYNSGTSSQLQINRNVA